MIFTVIYYYCCCYSSSHWLFKRKFEKPGRSYSCWLLCFVVFFFFAKVFFIPGRVLFFPQHLLFSFPSASVLRGNRGAARDRAHVLGDGEEQKGRRQQMVLGEMSLLSVERGEGRKGNPNQYL